MTASCMRPESRGKQPPTTHRLWNVSQAILYAKASSGLFLKESPEVACQGAMDISEVVIGCGLVP
jgi:hypothetical protein